MAGYESQLRLIVPQVSFGWQTIYIYQPEQIRSAQVGYSIGTRGESLSGIKDGDWRSEWIVIGHAGLCGDPIFIDNSDSRFPVFTARHGEARWDAVQIALSLMTLVVQGRSNPVALESNPLTPEERNSTLAEIRLQDPYIDLGCWENLLGSES